MEFVRLVGEALFFGGVIIVAAALLALAIGALYVIGWALLIGLVLIGVGIENTVRRWRRPKPIPELAAMRREGVPPEVWVQGPAVVDDWRRAR